MIIIIDNDNNNDENFIFYCIDRVYSLCIDCSADIQRNPQFRCMYKHFPRLSDLSTVNNNDFNTLNRIYHGFSNYILWNKKKNKKRKTKQTWENFSSEFVSHTCLFIVWNFPIHNSKKKMFIKRLSFFIEFIPQKKKLIRL